MISRRILLTASALAGCGHGQPVRRRDPRRSSDDIETLEKRIFAAVNQRRTKASALPLVWSDALATHARRHSVAMLEGGFFSHTDPARGDLKRRLSEGKGTVRWSRIAENLFMQSGGPDPVSAAIEGWMKSAVHRRNILDTSYTDSGIGCAAARDGKLYVTQIFALLLPESEEKER